MQSAETATFADTISEELEAHQLDRYPEKSQSAFRNYQADERPTVREFYRLNHTFQTLDFVRAKKQEFLKLNRMSMGIWEAMEYLNNLVDDSDPDTSLNQIEHLLQAAEAARAKNLPDWFILTALIHDLGKILCLWGEPQWAVVGDTFVTGCKWPETIVFHEYFEANPDKNQPFSASDNGVYEAGCGLDNVNLSWGHDEYLYHVVRDFLPEPALAMIRYHSFYPWHREGSYRQFMNGKDHEMLTHVQAFNPFDLYSKADNRPDIHALRPYYEELIVRYFPAKLAW